MEAVLRWPEFVKDVSYISFRKLLKVCMVLVLSGILCLCVCRYVQNGRPEAEGKDFFARTLAAANGDGLSGICCGAGNVTENLLGEKMEYKDNLGIYVTPLPVDSKEPKATVPIPGADISQNVPSGKEIPGIFDSRLTGKISEHPGMDSLEVSVPSVPNPAVKEEGPVINNPVGTREIAGFLIDEEGYITGCTASLAVGDGILVPAAAKECIGIRKDAFSGLESDVMEIFIPANITDIEPGALDVFSSFVYIEAAADNPVYYSKDGILYTYSGDTAVCAPESQSQTVCQTP